MRFVSTGVGGGVKSWNDSDLRCLEVFTIAGNQNRHPFFNKFDLSFSI